jgi:hypothetical protein
VFLCAEQKAMYEPGGVIVCEATSRCFLAAEGSTHDADNVNEVTFRITCTTYTSVSPPRDNGDAGIVPPAGARMRVTKLNQHDVSLQQLSDQMH